MEQRFIYDIAQEIRTSWKKVNFAAKPYLEAMFSLKNIKDNYYFDNGRMIVTYFLSNAGSWRGDDARRIKKELKDILKNG